MKNCVGKGGELLEDADEKLDRDDPVLEQIYQMYRSIDAGCSDVDAIIDKGRRLEDFE